MICFMELGSMLLTSSTVAARSACFSSESMVDLEHNLTACYRELEGGLQVCDEEVGPVGGAYHRRDFPHISS
jgi:hypothetical protein